MKPTGRVWAATFVLWMSPYSLRADGDGYYCATPGYLAYELRFTSGPDSAPPPGHTLFVVGLANDRVTQPIALPLPEFQVHGMRCTDTAVELAGWETVYVVDVGSDGRSTLRRALPRSQPGGAPAGFVETNLAEWAVGVRDAKPVTSIPLPASSRGVARTLEIRYGPHPSREGCRYQVQTYLRSPAEGTAERRILLAAADFRRDCH